MPPGEQTSSCQCGIQHIPLLIRFHDDATNAILRIEVNFVCHESEDLVDPWKAKAVGDNMVIASINILL
jgi:hypothetical protein